MTNNNNGEKLKAAPLRSGTRETHSPTFIQHSFRSPNHSWTSKIQITHPNGKKEVKLSLFIDDMGLSIENPKDSIKKKKKRKKERKM